MTTYEKAWRPEDITRLFVERANARDPEGIAALYEEQAVMAYPPGALTTGRAAIRELWARVLPGAPRFAPEEPPPALVSGDIALTATVARDGAGARAQVARRQPDGSWLRLLTSPSSRRPAAEAPGPDGAAPPAVPSWGVRILVTGHRGHVGAPVAAHLRRLGHEVAGVDRADGDDLLDAASVRRAAEGCAAVVHLAAIAHDTAGTPEDIMAVNVLGTWHVLLAAGAAAAGQVIHFSSAQVFGTAEGEREPDYLPVGDAHPRRATRTYGLSKCLAEDLCAGFTTRTGIPTVSLRPARPRDPGTYQRVEARWRADPAAEWSPFWELGGFVDVRDVAAAVERALTVPLDGHHRLLLCAADMRGEHAEPHRGRAARPRRSRL